MFKKNLILVIYDVCDNKKRQQLAKCLQAYGRRVQKSCFECLLTNRLYKKMLKESNNLIDKKTDSLRVYSLNNSNKKLIYGIGKKEERNHIKFF